MQIELRERTFGEMIGQLFSLVTKHYLALFLIMAVFSLPSQVAPLLVEEGMTAMAIVLIVGLVLNQLAGAMGILILASSYTGQKVSLGSSLSVALRKLGPLILVSLVTGVIIGIGIVLLIVPGLIFMSWWALATSALVIEDVGWMESMERSKKLTEGGRLQLIGYFIVVSLLIYVPVGVIGGILAGMGLVAADGFFVNYVLGALAGPFALAIPIVYYFNRRVIKDGLDVESLTSLIDSIGDRGGART